jgi:hypothetical protein
MRNVQWYHENCKTILFSHRCKFSSLTRTFWSLGIFHVQKRLDSEKDERRKMWSKLLPETNLSMLGDATLVFCCLWDQPYFLLWDWLLLLSTAAALHVAFTSHQPQHGDSLLIGTHSAEARVVLLHRSFFK